MSKDRKFFIWAFALGLLVLLAVLASAIGNILAYFQTGADRSEALHLVSDLPDEYTPRVVWLEDDPYTGRVMEDFTRTRIVSDYVRSLYQWNLSYLLGEPTGIREYYSKNVRDRVTNSIDAMVKQDIQMEQVELTHHLQLHFYSADGQIVSFTDHQVETQRRFFKNASTKRFFADESTSNYEVVLILDDGYWRIKHLVRRSPSGRVDSPKSIPSLPKPFTTRNDTLFEGNTPFFPKGINYYPQATPWKDFWRNYSADTTRKDFELIKSLGFNTVRIFVNYLDFGKGNLQHEMMRRLADLLDKAEKQDLKVIVTLFDFMGTYRLLDFPATDRQLENILTTFATHPAILAWDLKNEPDLDYNHHEKEDVQDWLRYMVRQARKYDPNHLITIGWAYPESAGFLADKVDVVSFHFYRNPEELGPAIENLRQQTGNKPLMLEEYGLSSYRSFIWPANNSENKQAAYVASIRQTLRKKGNIPSIIWTLYDFTEVGGDIAGGMPWQRASQKHFGIIRPDGTIKPVHRALLSESTFSDLGLLDKIPYYLITYLLIGSILIAGYYFLKVRKVRFRGIIRKKT